MLFFSIWHLIIDFINQNFLPALTFNATGFVIYDIYTQTHFSSRIVYGAGENTTLMFTMAIHPNKKDKITTNMPLVQQVSGIGASLSPPALHSTLDAQPPSPWPRRVFIDHLLIHSTVPIA